MSSTPQEIKAMLKAGIPVAIVPRTSRSRDTSLISSVKRKYPSTSARSMLHAIRAIREARKMSRTRRTRRNDVIQVRNTESPASRHVSVLRDTIKQMLCGVRTQSGLTQKAVADKLGVPATNISRLESGRLTPSVVTIDAFVRACGYELNMSVEKMNAGTSGTNSQPSPSLPVTQQ